MILEFLSHVQVLRGDGILDSVLHLAFILFVHCLPVHVHCLFIVTPPTLPDREKTYKIQSMMCL